MPLLLSDAFHAQADVPALVGQVAGAHPGAPGRPPPRPIGPEAQLLSIIDRRLRDALRARRVARAGRARLRRRRQRRRPQQRPRRPPRPAVGDPPPAALRDGVRHRLRARRTAEADPHPPRPRAADTSPSAAGSSPPACSTRAQAELALEAGAVAVSEPMGGEPEIAEVALTRYVVAAMELVDLHELETADQEPSARYATYRWSRAASASSTRRRLARLFRRRRRSRQPAN